MDTETGETEFISKNGQYEQCEFDVETGEPSSIVRQIIFPKRKFNIPKQYLENKSKKHYMRKSLNCKETFTLTDKNKVINFKEEIILGYNKTSHRMYLLPTLFFFSRFAIVILVICEIILHIWAHKKNSRNTNPNIYYRSPVHIVTSQFCAICRSQLEGDHIKRIQNKRHLHANIKHVTRTLT